MRVIRRPFCWFTRPRRACSPRAPTSAKCATAAPITHSARSMPGCSSGSRRTAGRRSPSSTGPRSAEAARWRSPATSGSRVRGPSSPSRNCHSASSPVRAGTGGSHNSSAWPPRGACCTPGLASTPPRPLPPAWWTRSRTTFQRVARPWPSPSRNGPGVPSSSQSWRCAPTAKTPPTSTRRRKRCCSTAQTSTSG